MGDRFQADVWWEAARGACEDAHLANYAIATGQADATMTGTDQGAVRIDDRVEIGYDDATPDWTFAKFAPDR